MNPFFDAYETSLSKLDDHDWNILSSRHSRGIDWMVSKLGRKWVINSDHMKGFGLFKTKSAAYDAATNLILAESRWRAARRYEEANKDVAIPAE